MTLASASADPASLRDPSGTVYRIEDRIYRSVSAHGAKAFMAAWQQGVLQRCAEKKQLIATELLTKSSPEQHTIAPDAAYILRHPTLPLVTYPYEWSFGALKAAATAHLDLQLSLLDEGFTLSDASAFNMQFVHGQPIHIDVLSVIPYSDGMRWHGYRQFLQHFFNPLVLESATGISFSPFFRGTLDGITSDELLRLVPTRWLLKPSMLMHLVTPALAERHANTAASSAKVMAPLPKHRYRGLLLHLRQIIAALQPKHTHRSLWSGYSSAVSYATDESIAKQQQVKAFIATYRPKTLLDVGCNKGDYAAIALAAGTQHVIGLDSDRSSVNHAFDRAAAQSLNFTPLMIDITNPSPAQGWNTTERSGLMQRVQSYAAIALAILHHVVIGKNIPMKEALAFLVALAPRGLIEFIPKSDPQVAGLLRYREDIFPHYTLEMCKMNLLQYAGIVAEHTVSASGRTLIEFERIA